LNKLEINNLPLVTVYTLIYNTNPIYIIEAIKSVIENNYPKIQHIIIDDYSTIKESKDEIKKWIDDNQYQCEFYEHPENYGVVKTMNEVLQLAKGKYLIPACDDILGPLRIMTDICYLESCQNPKISLVHSISQTINEASQKQYHFYPTEIPTGAKINCLDFLLNTGNFINAPSVTFVRDVFLEVGGFDKELPYEDFPMWIKLTLCGFEFEFIPQINTYYRRYNASLSARLDYKFEDFKIVQFYVKRYNLSKKYLLNRLYISYLNDRKLFYKAINFYNAEFTQNFLLLFLKINIFKNFKTKVIRKILKSRL
jgi:alpha-1,3-rhamnosyltransferase